MTPESPGVAIVGGGLLLFLLGLLLGRRSLRVLGVGAALAGGALVARDKFEVRTEKIDLATSTVRSALDDLDPIARAQVIDEIVRSD
jgi:hypothetical protein